MKFSEYINEMPVIIPPDHITCPKGATVEPFDMALEDISIGSKNTGQKLAQQVIQKTGIVPMYCQKHNKFFMHDFDTGKSWYPDEDIKKINILLNSMFKHATGRGDDKKLAKKLKKIKLPWNIPPKVFGE